jgi:DNA-binding NarL/FixJ family response regulator
MPGGGGVDALKRIKSMNPSAKFLISTGSGHDPEVKGLMNLGCQGLIEKPFGLEIMSEAITAILGPQEQ